MPEEAIRYRRLRADAKIGSVAADLELKLGLPVGSIQFVKPDGKRIRSDALWVLSDMPGRADDPALSPGLVAC